MAKIMLATGLIVAYGYVMEVFMAWYSGNAYELYVMQNRTDGPVLRWAYWALILCNVARRRSCCGSSACGRTSRVLFVISLIVNVGMWLERFVIIVISLHRDFLPSSWGMYSRTDLGLGDVPRHDRAVLLRCCSCSSASCR